MENILSSQDEFNKLSKNIFRCIKGNSRGIELTKDFFQHILDKKKFHIKVTFENILSKILDPIERRLRLLELL